MAIDLSGIVRFQETEKKPNLLELNRHRYLFDENCEFCALRSPLVGMLDQVSGFLAAGEKLLILDAYRSPERQMKVWDTVLTDLQKKHPNWSEKQLKLEACRWAGNPEGLDCPHRMGAAVDLTICDKEGRPLDLGLPSEPDMPTSNILTPEQQQNRNRLLSLMVAVGFVADAQKGGHFSYGDEAWARVMGKRQTLYKPVKHLILKSICTDRG